MTGFQHSYECVDSDIDVPDTTNVLDNVVLLGGPRVLDGKSQTDDCAGDRCLLTEFISIWTCVRTLRRKAVFHPPRGKDSHRFHLHD